jgi:hypothetical protein
VRVKELTALTNHRYGGTILPDNAEFAFVMAHHLGEERRIDSTSLMSRL